jgi:hypothetical protein
MEDPDNEDRILKIPPHVRDAIKADALAEAVQRVESLSISPQDWDYTSKQSYGDIRHEAWQEAVAAIKGEQEYNGQWHRDLYGGD